jgi:PAS domain S-box-containing protein
VSENEQNSGGRTPQGVSSEGPAPSPREAEEALREGEERLRLSQEVAHIGTFDWHVPTGKVVWTEEEERIFGLEPGTFEGNVEGWASRVVPEDVDRMRAEMRRAMERGDRAMDFAFRIVRPDGSVRRIEGSGRFTYDAEGRPLHMVGFNIDATERRRAEEEARRLADIIEATTDFVALSRADGRVVYINRAGRRMIGIPEDADLGDYRRAALSPQWAYERTQAEWLPEAMREGSASGEGALLTREGREIPVSFVLLVHRDATGELEYVSTIARDVSERKRAEDTLARYEVFSRLSRDMMLFVRPDGRIVEANEAAAAAYGYSHDELLTKSLRDVRGPDTLPLLGEQLRRADEGGILFETTHRRRDGSTFPVEVSATGADVAGERLVLSVIRDITERKAAEEELRRSQQLFEGVAEAIPDVLYLYDLEEGRVTYTNREVWNVLGYTPEQVEAMDSRLFESLLHPDDLPRVPEHLARLTTLRDGEVEEFEFRMRHADGGYRWLLSRDVVFTRTAAGLVKTTCGVTQDVTVRRQGLKLIEGQNRVLEMLAAGEPLDRLLEVLIRVVEEQGGEMLCSVLMVSEDGQTLRRGVAPSLPPAYFEQSEGLPVGPLSGSCGTAAHRREAVVVGDIASDPLWAGRGHVALAHGLRACWSTPVVSSTGQVLAVFGVYYREPRRPRPEERRLVEVAAHVAAVAIERRQAERERELLLESESAARVEAERANRLKDEFLATLSHELRTPLTAIHGWAKMLAGGALDAETARRAVQVIERNAEAQRQIVDDVLDASRIITGKLRVEPEEVDLLGVVRESLDAMRPAAEAKGIELICNFDPQAGRIVGDPHRLRQVIWNLLSNAVKFTDRGGCVEVEAGQSLSSVRLTVSDTGAGIAPEFLPYVFDRFRQADGSTTRQHGGLGLGLSIVRHIVEAHGGSVHAYSAGVGQGASFTVELPLPAGVQRAPRKDARAGQPPGRGAGDQTGDQIEAPPALFGVRVLVVEDDPDTLELMKVFLARHGAEVTAAASAAGALEALGPARPDVIVSDIGMPGEDGYELMRRVRSLAPEAGGLTPAVALTAYATDADRLKALRAGFQAHVGKPVDPPALLAAIINLAALRKTEA